MEISLHRSGGAEFQRQRPGVDSVDCGDSGLDQGFGKGLFRAPVAGFIVFMHQKAVEEECAGFLVGPVDSAVADFRAGHCDKLTGIGGIAENFLVSAHSRVEHNLSGPVDSGSDGATPEHGSVLKCEKCLFFPRGFPVISFFHEIHTPFRLPAELF